MERYAPTTSFSGSDMIVHFAFPNARPISVGTASTISYSTFREKRQVRTLGRISAKGVTKGPRTVGGTMIFTSIRQHIINDIMDELKTVPMYANYDKIKPDELPPFDIIVTFANEYGQSAKLIIYGVTLLDDGKTLSIEDIFTENQMTFIARDIEHMKSTTDNMNSLYEKSYRVDQGTDYLGKFKINKIDTTQAKVQFAKQAKQINDKYKDPTYNKEAQKQAIAELEDRNDYFKSILDKEKDKKLEWERIQNKYTTLHQSYPNLINLITTYYGRMGKSSEDIQRIIAKHYDYIRDQKRRGKLSDNGILNEIIKMESQ